jgi:hypothetical protein
MTRLPNAKFSVCVWNQGHEASLERNKIYAVVDDPAAAADGDLRVVDESGEDYLYPAAGFIAIDVPDRVQEPVLRATA